MNSKRFTEIRQVQVTQGEKARLGLHCKDGCTLLYCRYKHQENPGFEFIFKS